MNIINASVFNPNATTPLSNVNPQYVNIDNSNDPAQFTSKYSGVVDESFGLPRITNNVLAADASRMTGGSKRKSLRKKIKNIVNKYKKMKGGKKTTLKGIKMRLTKLLGLKSKKMNKSNKSKKTKSRKNRTRRVYRGGVYQQYMSNVPYTPAYSTGGVLSASNSALANPVPYQQINTCQDNYNHFASSR